mmetsp:Transcript_48639/g.115458  ORF Transcript_48639/g.115458 Transcript_48639/m.115458 type:complete len:407 (-) Transcript_48639:284-1504(-)
MQLKLLWLAAAAMLVVSASAGCVFTFDSALTHWYEFENDAPFMDSSGNENHLAMINFGQNSSRDEADCKFGTCVLMDNPSGMLVDDPTAQYMQMPDLPIGDYANTGITVTAWFKVNVASQNCARIFDWGYRTFLISLACHGMHRDPVFDALKVDTPSANYRLGATLKDDKWHHVAWVIYPANHPTKPLVSENFYDGTLLGAITFPRTPLQGTWTQNYIGKCSWPGIPIGSNYFDDFRVYNSPLSEADISGMFSGATGVDCGGTACAECQTCSDGVQNQDETGVDCGGTTCAECPCLTGFQFVPSNPDRMACSSPPFDHPVCQESRTWGELDRVFTGKRPDPDSITAGLGKLARASDDRFWNWICLRDHPCLSAPGVNGALGDFMCFVYDEFEKQFIPWGKKSKLQL